MFKILVCGSRTARDYEYVKELLFDLTKVFAEDDSPLIIVGGAAGVDSFAEKAAIDLGINYVVYPADWTRYGNAAGPIRNQEMLDKEDPNLVVAIWDGESRGTLDMIKKSIKYGVDVVVYPLNKKEINNA